MGVLLQEMGKLEEARPLYEEALQGKREALGDRHPGTLISIYNLADLLENQDMLTGAILLFTELLEARVSLLGMMHEKTSRLAKKLVGMLRKSSQHDDANALAAKHGV